MARFKKGDLVWLYYVSQPGNYPGLYARPGRVTKRIHPTSYMIALASIHTDPRRPIEEWRFYNNTHEHHPSDMLEYRDTQPWEDNHCTATEHLQELRERWKAEAPAEAQAAWWKSEEERERVNRELNRKLRPILSRMLA